MVNISTLAENSAHGVPPICTMIPVVHAEDFAYKKLNSR